MAKKLKNDLVVPKEFCSFLNAAYSHNPDTATSYINALKYYVQVAGKSNLFKASVGELEVMKNDAKEREKSNSGLYSSGQMSAAVAQIIAFRISAPEWLPALRYTRNLVLEGVPGTGKTHVLGNLVQNWTNWMYGEAEGKANGRKLARSLDPGNGLDPATHELGPGYFFLTMHPATSYEDFVEGLRTAGTSDHAAHASRWFYQQSAPAGGESNGRDGKVSVLTKPTSSSALGAMDSARAGARFEVVDGFFLRVCIQAARNPQHDYLVVLDELNRCNLPKVMGDLLTTLESSKRAKYKSEQGAAEGWDADDRVAVTLPVSGRRFFVPDNVYVLATMNTTDRSVTPMDAALRRRFAFHRLWPIGTSAAEVLSSAKMVEKFETTWEKLQGDRRKEAMKASVATWADINQKLSTHGPDVLLGHSYLFALADDLGHKRAEGLSDKRLGAYIAEVVQHHWNAHILPQLIDIVVSNDLVDVLLPVKQADKGELDLNAVGLSVSPTGGFTFRGYLRGKNFAAVPMISATYVVKPSMPAESAGKAKVAGTA